MLLSRAFYNILAWGKNAPQSPVSATHFLYVHPSAPQSHIFSHMNSAFRSNSNNLTTCSELVNCLVAVLILFLVLENRNGENDEKIQELVTDICEQWPISSDIPTINTSDEDCKLTVRLRNMFVKSKGRFRWLLGVFPVSAPHNIGTECVVSHHNQIKSIHRQSTTESLTIVDFQVLTSRPIKIDIL